ncbi:hypothetical protein BDW02DRAFT_282517 [Decorospora gaudefroyi]|uniref:Uncharacterized protein n=1 Tax=Decorospora gaudefroyi TaxID=184978 RepID=A0A6A5KJA7_9PLEO|nr:hypothetical protein BDW02DRAFT_282517 [Decorospora gaudefroyi]
MQNSDWASSKFLTDFIKSHVEKEAADGHEDVWSSWLSVPFPPLTTYKYVLEQRKMFERIGQLLPAASIPAFNEWKNARLVEGVQHVRLRHMSIEYAKSLVELLPLIPCSVQITHVLPNLETMTPELKPLRFLMELSSDSVSGIPRHDSCVKPAFQKLAKELASSWRVSMDDLLIVSPPHHRSSYSYINMPSLSVKEDLLEVFHQHMKLGSVEEGCQILKSKLPVLPAVTDKFWLRWVDLFTFHVSLLGVLEAHKITALNEVGSQ